ncbi:protein kinase [Polyangium aurulentum]|nr:protein kinase [Polyangium aurulentum]
MPLSRREWQPPSEFDGYRLIRLIGRGGMGSIYLAQDTLLDRPVAIKFIASVRPDATARDRFVVEARALARLSHPNVVAVHRVGEVDARPYLVAEFIRGRSLADLDKPLAWERVLRIGKDLARGLGAAHRERVLHRDLKPENAMLADGGAVKLIDFGLAKLIEKPLAALGSFTPHQPPASSRRAAFDGDGMTQGLTRGDAFVGTPLYMAPEVLRGAEATPASDVYALGAVLYELCTGAAHREVVSEDAPLDEWIDAEPAPLAAKVKGIDPDLAAVIARCLARNPASRYASGEELAAALEPVDAEESSAAIPEGNPYRGLHAFEAEHRALFFGRDRDIRAVVDRLRAQPLVVIAGDSGVGKSSLCRAGVLPRVAEGALGEDRAFQVFTLVPGRSPLAALAAAIASVKTEEGAPPSSGLLERDDLESLARELQRRMGQTRGVVLFVDQLEELVTLAKPAEAARFAELLARLGSVAAGVRVLATVRGDFFTRLVTLPALGDELMRGLYVLRPLGPESIRAAITAPARRTGVTFESEALVDALVEAGVEAAGGLPVLQFAMAELWEARDPRSQRIPAAALDTIGGVAGALARHGDAVIAALGPAEAAAARKILVRLVTAEGTRARRTASELVRGDAAAGAALEALIGGRLVVAREMAGNERASLSSHTSGIAYEVAHEALIRGWGTLRGWLEQDGEERRVRARIEAAAAEWKRLGGASEALWSERQLAEAARIPKEELGPEQRDFLTASRRSVRRARLLKIVTIAAAPVFVALAILGLRLKAQYDIDRMVEGYEAEARIAVADGNERKAKADELRKKALAQFVAVSDVEDVDKARKDLDAADGVWTGALGMARGAEDALARGGQALEAGLLFDPSRAGLRARLREVLLARLELATWFHHSERREDLERRLALYGGLPLVLPRLSIRASPEGTEAKLARYEEKPSGARVLGEFVTLGRTPIADAEVASGPGSYLLTLHAAGKEEVRYPILLERGARAEVVLELPPDEAVPEKYVYVPPGRFLFGSADEERYRRGTLGGAQPEHEIETAGYLIGRTEVTFAEWIEFLRWLPAAERATFRPSAGTPQWKLDLDALPGGEWQLTLSLNGTLFKLREGEPVRIVGREKQREQDWRRFPVTAIAPQDVMRYAEFLRATARLPGARICDEREWERAARGADDRMFPHGDLLAPNDANYDETYGRKSDAFGPDEVGSHPSSASPFDVLDLAGNALEMTRSAVSRGAFLMRGGAWYYDAPSVRSSNRSPIELQTRDPLIGVRMCADFPPRGGRASHRQ